MTEQELLNLRDLAESGVVQFKERATDRYDIGCEMVAFSNSHGGRLIIGINDKSGEINALSYIELQETTNLLTNVAADVRRALEYGPKAVFSNRVSDSDVIIHSANEFVITIPRESNQVTDPAEAKTDPVADLKRPKIDPVQEKTDSVQPTKLSKKQQDIRNYCSVPRSRQEILQRAGVSDHFDNRKKYIYELVELGVLERTIPDKPNDPNQRYRRKK